jgi:hypothetical protein
MPHEEQQGSTMPAEDLRGFTANNETPSFPPAPPARGGYRCVEPTVARFIERLAVGYLAKGLYPFYAAGWIPAGKDPATVDAKLLAKYRIGISKHAKFRRRRAGIASVQYLRHERFWVLLASHGEHPIFATEPLHDLRRLGLQYAGHLVTIRNGHVRVSIAPRKLAALKRGFADRATRWTADQLASAFWAMPFRPYAPVRQQVFGLLGQVNRRRAAAGLPAVPWEQAVRTKRNSRLGKG